MYPDAKDEVVQLHLDDIIPNRFQPREVFDERALKELAVSIKEHGVIQPIIVRNVNGKYEIIAGERRYKASALAGLTKIPAIVRDLDDKESSKVALLENLQRKNLNPIEEARTYQKILELDEMKQEDLARTMGKSQSAVANKLRLLTLPEEIQEALLKEEISERHARALLMLDDHDKQKEMMQKVIDNKMSVRSLEDEIKSMLKEDEPEEGITTSSSAFVNDSPLIPTAELEEDKSNYGKVTIAPPDGENVDNKFINFGEEEKEDETEELTLNTETEDLNKNNQEENNLNKESADLDNLLNINTPNINNTTEYITPAEKIVKADTLDDDEQSEDYFKTADLSGIELPSSIINPEDNELLKNSKPTSIPEEENNLVPASEYSKETYSIEDAKEKIKEAISDIEKHGIKIKTDELDFEKNYQIIIKIDKE